MRAALLDELRGVADAAARGSGALILLTGEAGIGKTSIARALARDAHPFAVSWGNCSADGSAPPFWPWQDVVPAPDAAPSAETRFALLRMMRDELMARARHHPVLHVIEDLQWADVASVLLLTHVANATISAPLLIVATLRTGEEMPPPLADAIEEAQRGALVRAVPPLRDDEIEPLLRDAGIAGDAELTALVRTRTGGNALFVTELLRTVRADDSAQRLRENLAGNVPARVAELIARRLQRLPRAVSDLVAAAAVLGASGDLRTLATVARLSIEDAVDLSEQARAARLLEPTPAARWRFRHDLVRDAVYSTLDAATRTRLHAAALDALSAVRDTPAGTVAYHALSAQPLLRAEQAIAFAMRAGEAAFAQHAYEEAVVWFERALTAASGTNDAHQRAELLIRAGEARRFAGDIEAARRALLDAAAITNEPALLARAALGYADPGADLAIAYRNDNPVTSDLLERALAAQPDADSVTRVLLQARLAAELYFSRDRERSRELIDAAVAAAGRLGDKRAMVLAGAVRHDAFVVGQAPLDEQLRGSAQLLALARESPSAMALLAAHRARVFDLLAAGDVRAVDEEILEFGRVLDTVGAAPGFEWWVRMWSAMRALLEGQHDEAETRALAAFSIGEASFPALAFGNLGFFLFFLRREQGRAAEMEQATRDFASSHPDIPATRVALTMLLAEIGRTEEAAAMLAEIDAATLAALRDRNWPASWFQLARAAYLVADRALARTLLTGVPVPTERCVQISLATVCLGATDLAIAWLHDALGDGGAAARHRSAAAELHARIGMRSAWAETHAARTAAGRDASASFTRAGATWAATYGGVTAQVPHSRGLVDLAALLARPGEALSVLELLGDGADASGGRGATALDDRARREIRHRMHALDAAIADAQDSGNSEQAARAREELQQLAEFVAHDLGLGGRSRRVGDPVERARKTVSTRIRRAIAAVKAAHPELGRHLERSVDTGMWCAYRPAERVSWTT